MPVTGDIVKNRDLIAAALERAGRDGSDILLTPEGSLSGYTSHFQQADLAPALSLLTGRAKALSVGLALGTCFHETDGRCYNQVRVYGGDGAYLGFHSKILRCSSLDAPGTGELAEYAATELRTFEIKGVTFGCLVCSDLWATPGWNTTPNPYLAWQLKKLGARFILHAVNSGADQRYRKYHESNLSLWAMALKIPIVTVNSVPGKGASNASSGVLGPDGGWKHRICRSGTRYFSSDLEI
jgi:predicted amidohydrolase